MTDYFLLIKMTIAFILGFVFACHACFSYVKKLKLEINHLTDLHIESMKFQDHPCGCKYGGITPDKTSDNPKDCSCDCGVAMRMALGIKLKPSLKRMFDEN